MDLDEPEVPPETAEGDVEEGNPEGAEPGEGGDQVEGEHAEGAEGEHVESEAAAGETVEGEHAEGEHVAGEHVAGEHTEGEQTEVTESEVPGEGEELMGEGLEEEHVADEEKTEEPVEVVEEEEVYVEEPPPDPAAPYNLSDSQEMLKAPFELRPDQLAEVEDIWAGFQDYTPAYTDIKDYITEKELIYMLESLMLMPFTPEQLQELIEYCVRPPHPEGHITYEQFLKMVTIRQRSINIEDELRAGLQHLDPEKTGSMDREYFREVLSQRGFKMPPKQLEYLIKEVDIANDGTIGIDDVVGTMCVDLNTDDIEMLRNQLWPGRAPAVIEDED